MLKYHQALREEKRSRMSEEELDCMDKRYNTECKELGSYPITEDEIKKFSPKQPTYTWNPIRRKTTNE